MSIARPAFFIPTILYGLGLILVLLIGVSSKGRIEVNLSLAENIMKGVRYVYTHPAILSIMLLTVVHCAMTMAFESVFPYFSSAARHDQWERPF